MTHKLSQSHFRIQTRSQRQILKSSYWSFISVAEGAPGVLARSVMTLSKSASAPLSVTRRQNSGWSLKAAVIMGAWKAAHLLAKTLCICEYGKNICITNRLTSSRHRSSGPLHVHLFSGSDNLEWSIIRRTSPFAKIFHDDGIAKLPTLQGSLGHLSAFLLGMCVPLLELLHDLWRAFKVLWIWFALLHLFRTIRKSQVLPAADGPPIVSQSAKQSSFGVTLLRVSLVRERTSQDLVRVHCSYWSMVVLWPGRHSFGDLPRTWRRHFSVSLYFSGQVGFFCLKKK